MRVRIDGWILLSLAFAGQAIAQQGTKTGLSAVQAAVAAETDTGGRPGPSGIGTRAGGRTRSQLRPEGSVHRIAGARRRVYPGKPHEAARAFLRDNPDLIGNVDPQQLQELPARRIGPRTYIRFQQQIDGVPVRGAQAIVAFNASSEPESLSSRLDRNLRVRRGWNLSAQDAVARVAGHTHIEGEPKTEKFFVVRRGEAVPVWRVVVRASNPPGVWEYLVSAIDGTVLESQNLRRGQQALGYAYPRNPLSGPAEKVVLDGLAASNRLTSDQTKVYSYLPALMGQVAPDTVVQLATRQDGQFLYTPDNPRFSEVQLFYGMQRANALFGNLGFPGWDVPLAGVVLFQDYDSKQGRFAGADNAYFSPEDLTPNGGLFFYLTSRNGDTSLDSDVIFHEYTHAIVEYATGGGQSARFQAINEGTADYFSDSFMDDAKEAEYASKIFGLRGPFLRTAENQNRWPSNVVGECHADGNIWSGAFWDVRNMFGADAAERIAIHAVRPSRLTRISSTPLPLRSSPPPPFMGTMRPTCGRRDDPRGILARYRGTAPSRDL